MKTYQVYVGTKSVVLNGLRTASERVASHWVHVMSSSVFLYPVSDFRAERFIERHKGWAFILYLFFLSGVTTISRRGSRFPACPMFF